MEIRKLPFHTRLICGLGFAVVGAAGVVGSLAEAGRAFSTSWTAMSAEWDGNNAKAAHYQHEHTSHQWRALADGLTGLASIAAGSVLLQGTYRRIMRWDGYWGWQGMEEEMPIRSTEVEVDAVCDKAGGEIIHIDFRRHEEAG